MSDLGDHEEFEDGPSARALRAARRGLLEGAGVNPPPQTGLSLEGAGVGRLTPENDENRRAALDASPGLLTRRKKELNEARKAFKASFDALEEYKLELTEFILSKNVLSTSLYARKVEAVDQLYNEAYQDLSVLWNAKVQLGLTEDELEEEKTVHFEADKTLSTLYQTFMDEIDSYRESQAPPPRLTPRYTAGRGGGRFGSAAAGRGGGRSSAPDDYDADLRSDRYAGRAPPEAQEAYPERRAASLTRGHRGNEARRRELRFSGERGEERLPHEPRSDDYGPPAGTARTPLINMVTPRREPYTGLTMAHVALNAATSTPAARLGNLDLAKKISAILSFCKKRYSGATTDNLLEFAEEMTNAADICGLEPQFRTRILEVSLQGAAATFYKSLPSECKSDWHDAIHQLERYFNPYSDYLTKLSDYFSRKQTAGESVQTYCEELMKLRKNLRADA